MYDVPQGWFLNGSIPEQIAYADARWDSWFGDEVVFNTGCFWNCATSGQYVPCADDEEVHAWE